MGPRNGPARIEALWLGLAGFAARARTSLRLRFDRVVARSLLRFLVKQPRHLLVMAGLGVLATGCVHLAFVVFDEEGSAAGVSLLMASCAAMGWVRLVVMPDHERSLARTVTTTLRRDVRARFSTLAEELTPAVVAFESEDGPPGTELFSLVPTDPRAAPVVAVVTDTEVALGMGEGRWEEDEVTWLRSHDRVVRRIDELCRSVVDGGLEETVYRRSDRFLGSASTLTTPSGARRSSTFWFRPRRANREVVRYKPYAGRP